MDFEDFQRVDRQTWRKYLFYIDLAVFAIFVISLILMGRHSFMAGQLYEADQFSVMVDVLWYVVADTVFLVASFCWIVYRFFRNQYVVMTRKF